MGGVFGHMSHLYDNPNLKFSQIKDVFQKASSGELVGTEKTDGQNLFVSYDVRDGTVRAARNKGNIKDGGMKPEALAAKFAGRGPLEETFVDAFDAFALAVAQMPDELKLQLFGPEANIYYNAEVQDPRAANIINYDVKTFNIHRTGHAEYDKETGAAIRDTSENAEILEQYLLNAQDSLEGTEYRVQVNAIRYLEQLGNDSALDEALMRLEKFSSKHGLSDNNTIGEYLVARLDAYVTSKVRDLNIEAKKLLMKRMFQEGYGAEDEEGSKARKVTQRAIIGALENPENAQIVKGLINTAKPLIKEFIYPLEDIIHDFSVAMLRGLQSAFVLDSEAEVTRQRDEVSAAIDAIEASGNEEAMEILQQQMRKLKNVERVSTAAEGFVFDYDGNTYKFTGNFAPINQILGLFKYGRGTVPPLRPLTAAEVLNEQIANKGSTFLFIPGGFKPPHKGHLHLLETAINQLPDAKPYLVTGETPRDGITLTQAMQVWKIYLQNNRNLDLDELSIITVPEGGLPVLDKEGKAIKDNKGNIRISNSPLQAIYNSGLGLPKGAELFIASSEADPGHAAIGKAIKEARPDLNVKAYQVKTLNDPETGGKLSARDIREALARGDFETFKKYLPNDEAVRRKAEYIFSNILGGKIKEEEETVEQEEEQPLAESFRSSDLFGLIEEVLNEGPVPLGDQILGPEGEEWTRAGESDHEQRARLGQMRAEKEGRIPDFQEMYGLTDDEAAAYKEMNTKKRKEFLLGLGEFVLTVNPFTGPETLVAGALSKGARAIPWVGRYLKARKAKKAAKELAKKQKRTDTVKVDTDELELAKANAEVDDFVRVDLSPEANRARRYNDPDRYTDTELGRLAREMDHADPAVRAAADKEYMKLQQAAFKDAQDLAASRGPGPPERPSAELADWIAKNPVDDAFLGRGDPRRVPSIPAAGPLAQRVRHPRSTVKVNLDAAGKPVKGSVSTTAPKIGTDTPIVGRSPVVRRKRDTQWVPPVEDLQEESSNSAGNVEGGMVSTGTKEGPWHEFDAEAFNDRQKKDAKPGGSVKGINLEEETLIEDIMNYLLEHEV